MSENVSFEALSKQLGGREVLKGFGFAVEQGDIFGYLGPNAAGNTITIRILLGSLRHSR